MNKHQHFLSLCSYGKWGQKTMFMLLSFWNWFLLGNAFKIVYNVIFFKHINMLICFVFWFNGQEWSSMPIFQITTLTAASHWMHEQSRDSAEAAQKQCESKVKTVCVYCAVIATAIISHSWCVACVMKIREFALVLTLNENEVTIITSRMFVVHVVQVVDWRKVITLAKVKKKDKMQSMDSFTHPCHMICFIPSIYCSDMLVFPLSHIQYNHITCCV